jgi:hypothetical protein
VAQYITTKELHWALDIVQTRNCRIPTTAIDINNLNINNENQSDDGNNDSNDDNNDSKHDQSNDDYCDENFDDKNDSDINNVVAPFFDLMNHSPNVNTVFELLTSSAPASKGPLGILSSPVETEPYLTVKYKGHGVKKGDQIYLNYRSSEHIESEAALYGSEYLLYSYGFTGNDKNEIQEVFLPKNVVLKYLLEDLNTEGGSPIMNIARTMNVRLGGSFVINSAGISSPFLNALRILGYAEKISNSIEKIDILQEISQDNDDKASEIFMKIKNFEIIKFDKLHQKISKKSKIMDDDNDQAYIQILELVQIKLKLLDECNFP